MHKTTFILKDRGATLFSAYPAFFFFFLGVILSFFRPSSPASEVKADFLLFCPALANACCSISTSIKLFLSCSAVTQSTAHNCRLRGLTINHTVSVSLSRTRVCVCVLAGGGMSFSTVDPSFFFFFLFFHESSSDVKSIHFAPLTPEMPMGPLSGLLVNEV